MDPIAALGLAGNIVPQKWVQFAQARFASWSGHKLALEEIARFEVVTLIGTLVSTIRTVTWMLYHIFSDAAVLNDCSKEVSKIMATSHTAQGTLMRSLDITTLKSDCPILGSKLQEVLRRRHEVGTSVRQVMRYTILEEKYLLKGGSVILMPSVVLHSDASIWGLEPLDLEMEAEVKVRSGFEDGKWTFRLNKSDVVFATAAEDLV